MADHVVCTAGMLDHAVSVATGGTLYYQCRFCSRIYQSTAEMEEANRETLRELKVQAAVVQLSLIDLVEDLGGLAER